MKMMSATSLHAGSGNLAGGFCVYIYMFNFEQDKFSIILKFHVMLEFEKRKKNEE
jgi:hypothetical protein